MHKEKLRNLVYYKQLHSYLIPVYAVLGLYSGNISEISVNAIWRLLVALTLCTSFLLILFRGLTKNWQKSGLVVSCLLLLFFTYGHMYNVLKDVHVGDLFIFRHRFLVVFWLVLGIIFVRIIWRTNDQSALVSFANTASIVMLLFPIYNIVYYISKTSLYDVDVKNQSASNLQLPSGIPAPDVYFIVLDAYGREDILRELFNLDNSNFVGGLKDMGFYVADCSQSNYARTRLSLTSTLNMDYIQNLTPPTLKPDELSFWIKPYLIHSQVRSLFEELGYKTIAFENGFQWLDWEDADYFLQPGENSSKHLLYSSVLTPFEELFLETTLFRAEIDFQLADSQSASSAPSRRNSILYTLDTLPKVPEIHGRKFVYAHLILPHPPFVFGPNGEEIYISKDNVENDTALYIDKAMRDGYSDQVLYTNRRILPILKSIIEKSPTPPIIILEGDHGPTGYGGYQNRISNLMAFYIPGKDASHYFYSTITPVNSFRLIFNAYFGGDYPILEDITYFSEATKNFNYQIIPNTCINK